MSRLPTRHCQRILTYKGLAVTGQTVRVKPLPLSALFAVQFTPVFPLELDDKMEQVKPFPAGKSTISLSERKEGKEL